MVSRSFVESPQGLPYIESRSHVKPISTCEKPWKFHDATFRFTMVSRYKSHIVEAADHCQWRVVGGSLVEISSTRMLRQMLIFIREQLFFS